jgi:hypothetical protein
MKVLKLVTATLLALGVAQSYADQTNLVQNVSIQLLGIKDGDTFTRGNLIWTTVDVVRLDTRRVVQALGGATGNSFSPAARLVLLTSVGNSPQFEVRDGATKVDVTRFFVYQLWSGMVHSGVVNTRTGRSMSTDYSIQRLALVDGEGYPPLTAHFDVNGFTTQTSVDDRPGDDVQINGAGPGDRNGDVLILQGEIGIFGHTTEVVAGTTDGGIS